MSESSTPGGDAHRRAPDPAGTRPKVDLLTRKPGSGAPTDPLAAPQDEAANRVVAAEGSEVDDAGLGQTFGRTGEREPSDAGPHPPLATFATPAAAASAVVARSGFAGSDVPRSRAETPHGPRFQFLIGALLALGISAIVITFVTLGANRDSTPADWSSWHPSATGFAAAAQIADHVGPEYRLATSAQMLAIQSGPLALDGVPLTLVRRSSASANANLVVLNGNAVLYKMCGLGASCSIVGTPTTERLTMVRREALELALNTFEFVGNADQVVVFLPPVVPAAGSAAKKTPTGATDALFFQASDYRSQLNRPLSTTLNKTPPTISTVDTASDTPVVKALTTQSFYTFSIVSQAADATVFLVLQPFTVG